MANYPTSIDSLTNPTATDKLNSPAHATQHTDANDILEALMAKVGADSSAVTTSHDYKLSGVTGSDKAVSLTGTETLTNKTLSSPKIDYIYNAGGDIVASISNSSGAANYVTLATGLTNNPSTIRANGTDTNVGLDIGSKGTGDIVLHSHGESASSDEELLILSTTDSAVNEVTIANATTGNPPTISATGDNTNIDLKLVAKGTGDIISNSGHQFADEAYFDAETDNGNSGTSDTINWTVGNKQKSTLTGDVTYTFTAPSGPCSLILRIIQDGTGGRDVTFPGSVTFLGTEPTWTDGGASKSIIVSLYYDGSTYWAQGTAWEA